MDKITKREGTNQGNTGEDISVLHVDDDPIARSIVERQLRRRGYRLVSVTNGPDALDRVAQTRFDAALLDVMMPGMSGVEVLRWLRETDPDLPVLMLTGSATPEILAEIRRLGCSGILEKPCDAVELRARLEAVTGRLPEGKDE